MEEYHYFVAHGFSGGMSEDFQQAINLAFIETGLKALYWDREFKSGEHILKKIEERILTTQFGIYDITNQNPNVSLELGLAKGAGKSLYIICQKGTKILSDLQGLERIEYEDYKDLTNKIKGYIIKSESERINEIKAQRKTYEKHMMPEEDVLKNCVKLYKAEWLHHKFGIEVEDKEAHSQKAWFADLSELRDHVIYGPYEELNEQGNYIAFFKIKIDDNQSIEPILFLDVAGGGGGGRMLCGIDFDKPLTYQLFAIRFNYPGKGKMEYRVHNRKKQNLKVWIDYVAIVKP
ncbi:MAG: nucleotide-binding protein (plasmid) [Candidatus Methanoperedens sp.]|uniref:TIR domain-containing protein n=1 Tax=Candidatus Methanoperedens sp. BLZ2 TaxID=2035255 RepID=UPI000BE250D2|nr:TIR domain-containing protein [Candidatus Methanoperedens sp. BLZ2]KAB2946449.1 MAG: nucleotide-binding protein [Candidatus Methanoperedens sp.]MBZ0175686.1 nucleotide-binding protein [Candidatus Methanoperedens nitroreducens]WAH95044.1 MAG: nucleotide-binding protein [Candidatus Methanoperedens sp.]WAM22234.1 MAG: nucleotide-binding protein [Candidatus Methanoperedens sp.]